MDILEKQIHVWSINLEAKVDTGLLSLRYLSEDEIDRAHRIKASDLRNRFVLARGALRIILSKYIEKQPGEIVISYGEQGKPYLKDECVKFNLTHCLGLGILAITLNRDIGVDLERPGRIRAWENIIKYSLSEREKKELSGYPKDEQEVAFIRAWTRKEAYTKAIGAGLLYDFSTFSVSLGEFTLEILEDTARVCGHQDWTLLSIKVEKPYIAALCVNKTGMEIKTFTFDSQEFDSSFGELFTL